MSLEDLMRRMLATAFVTAVLLVTTVPVRLSRTASSNNRHPYVGLAIQSIPSMPGFAFLCSGSALSSTVFLTAAHCFDETLPVFVALDSAPPFTVAQEPSIGTLTGVWAVEAAFPDSTRTMWQSSRSRHP